MKTSLFTTALFALTALQCAVAQQIPGLQFSNYGGLYRATYNPSVLGGPRHKFQVNVLTLGGSIKYRYFRFIGENAFLYPILSSHSTKELYGRSRTMGSLTYKDPIFLAGEIRWPSVSFALGKYHGIAIQLRTRGFVQGRNIPEEIDNLYMKRLDTGSTPPLSNAAWGDFSLVQQSFSDLSFSWGGQLLDIEGHKLRVGATVKRVFGARVSYIKGNADNYSIAPAGTDPDISQLEINRLSYETGYSTPNRKMSLGNLFDSGKYGSGWAYDLGFSYELGSVWKGRKETYNDSPDYLVRLAASVTDVGSVKYKTKDSRVLKGTQNDVVIGQTQLETISDRGPEGFMSLFPGDSSAAFAQSVKLPQAIHFEADVQVFHGFFLNLAQTSRFKSRDGQPLDMYQPNTFMVTPRFEDEDSGLSFPISFIQGNNRPSIGLAGHFGPVFLGFSNVNGLMKSGGARGSMMYIGFTAWKANRKKDKD
ncbi:hypothetical protein GCM10010967_48990 [Dyadobacter beijingensis]|uniref:DUF5723 domain-containing protein n=1 Tax=Dyadobacter beijingensis TaxID=365489 RepID=A0ABQ2IH39_9BACT|nr:DUF5723 family protein [Dyadobacter beijingensis]GGN07645.1 hypothetical protein GCM10010967_48990 [Dyadobacter beijingensis]